VRSSTLFTDQCNKKGVLLAQNLFHTIHAIQNTGFGQLIAFFRPVRKTISMSPVSSHCVSSLAFCLSHVVTFLDLLEIVLVRVGVVRV